MDGKCKPTLILPAVLQVDLERFIVHLRLFGKMTYLTLEKLIMSAKGSQLKSGILG